MANFKERLLGLIDNSAETAFDLVGAMNDTIRRIDWENQFNNLCDMKDSLIEKGNELLGEFNELMKQVKNNITDFEVSIPFDESVGEKFEYKIDGDKLAIEVTFKNDTTERSNKTTVTIPQNCDVEKATTKYNAIDKTMTVIIPKLIAENKEEEAKEEENPKSSNYKLSKMARPRRKQVKVEEESHQAESKLLKKFRENVSRVSTAASQTTSMPRGANGRFVKRTPKA